MVKTKKQLRKYNREYARKRRRREKLGVLADQNQQPRQGVDSENQIDSVIREMAELQAGIDHEKALCQLRVSLIQKYTNEVIEPWLTHQTALRALLLEFIKKQPAKEFYYGCRFGVVSYLRGKLKIKLNVDLAKRMIGKP